MRSDLGGALKEFTTRESHCFAQVKDDGSGGLFTSQERQWLVLQVLQGLRASHSDVEALQGKAKIEEGQSIGMSTIKYNITWFTQNKTQIFIHSKFENTFSFCIARVRIDLPNISIA